MAADVRQVFYNCMAYNDDSSEIRRQGSAMSRFFEHRYRCKVTGQLELQEQRRQAQQGVVARLEQQQAAEAAGGLQLQLQQHMRERQELAPVTTKECVRDLGCIPFHCCRLPVRVFALSWLCDEAVNAERVRDVLQAKMAVLDEAQMDIRRREKEREMEEKAERRRARGGGVSDGEDDEDEDMAVYMTQRQRAALEQQSEAESQAAQQRQLLAAQQRVQQVERLQGMKQAASTWLRQQPLGVDRLYNKYYLLHLGSSGGGGNCGGRECNSGTLPRVYVVDQAAEGAVSTYSTTADLEKLIGWLDNRGLREHALKVVANRTHDSSACRRQSSGQRSLPAFRFPSLAIVSACLACGAFVLLRLWHSRLIFSPVCDSPFSLAPPPPHSAVPRRRSKVCTAS
jgi:hypothetical protein